MPSRLTGSCVAFIAALTLAPPVNAWDEIHAGLMREGAECVSWGEGRVDCFARRADGHLSWTYLAAGKWSAPRDLGGNLAAAPSCVVRGPGGINCFATSAKGVLATIALNGSTWSRWNSLGGELIPSRALCVAPARDLMSCYARGRRGQLMMRAWRGGKTWDPWRDLGGSLTADPECIVASGAAACFGRSAAGELVAYLPDATGRGGGWTSLGGRVEGRPSCAQLTSGQTACVAQNRSGRLQMWRGMAQHAAGPGVTISTDDITVDEPACALQSTTLVCFVRSPGRQLVRRSLGTGVDNSRDGILPSPSVGALSCLSLGSEGLACFVTDTSGKLHFASNHALEAGAVEQPSTAADLGAAGAWYLSNLSTSAVCRVWLTSDLALGAKRMRLGPRCRFLELPGHPGQWDQDENELLFLDPGGQIVLRFYSTETGRWISPRRGIGFLLTREPPENVEVAPGLLPEPEPALPPRSSRNGVGGAPDMFSEMLGSWRVLAAGRGFVCTIRLTTTAESRGFAVLFADACASFLPPVRYWNDSGPAILFFDGSGDVVARFDSTGTGEWRADDLGGLTLSR